MRFPLILLAVTAVSASVVKRATAPNLPFSAFPKFKALTLEEAQNLPLESANSSSPSTGGHTNALMESFATVQTASAASCAANPGMRFEWRNYSASDRLAFIAAIKCMISKPPSGNFPPSTNRYEDFARLHQNYMPNIHGNNKFLIWHRYFLWTFEQALRKECGFNRAMVWWDETKDAGRFAQSDMFTNTAYFGHLPKAVNGQPVCITSGAFAGLTAHIGPGSSNTPHCLSRAVDESLTAQCNTNFVNTCNARTDYAAMEPCSEGGPHAYGHNGIGAVMSDVSSSPSDPIFWMHHSFVDHSYRLWQNAASSRATTIDGTDATGAPLTLNTVLHMGGLGPDVTIGAVLNTLSGTVIGGVPFCYRYNY